MAHDGHAHPHHGHVHRHPPAHGHGHHGHDHHDHAAHASHQRLLAALIVTVVAMIIGTVGGVVSGSLALIADAGHMLADAGSLGLGLMAARQALKPADADNSYGHERTPVLAAFVNGLLLLLASGWIALEALGRLITPEPVNGNTMLMVAALGLMANLICLALLHGGDKDDLNRRGAAAHVLSDLLGSVAAIVAAGAIMLYGWLPADPLLSLLAAALVLRIGLRIARESAHILLEGTPRHLDLEKIALELPQEVPGLANVHHLHAWSLSQTRKLMTLHALPQPGVTAAQLIADINKVLRAKGITHVTVQIETQPCGHEHCEHGPEVATGEF